MSDTVVLGPSEKIHTEISSPEKLVNKKDNKIPSFNSLEKEFTESNKLIDDIVLKKYLYKLSDLEIIPLPDEFKKTSNFRLFRISEMVYQKDEYSLYKFASVFNTVQSLNCGIFIIADSDGHKTDFYMGVRSFDNIRTTKSIKDTLKNALMGQFPGVKSKDLLDTEAELFLSQIPSKNISSVSCVANNKDELFKDNKTFIQGLEKFSLAMHGQKYTAVILAKSTSSEQLEDIRRSYETIYTHLSPFANMQLSYGTNMALSISDTLSHGTTTGTSYSENIGTSKSNGYSDGYTESNSVSKSNPLGSLVKTLGAAALGILSIATAPMTGGASLLAAGGILAAQSALSSYNPSTTTTGTSINQNHTYNETVSKSESFGENKSTSETSTKTNGQTSGVSENMQLSMQNKTLLNTLDRINLQLKRLNDCESIGMWECAAYFLSDFQETAEMAAATYKALMKGTQSGVETSAINYWGQKSKEKLYLLKEYITNFIHPVFSYNLKNEALPVTASSLVSSNELAIQMGLPRKSVCGFPVIEHADFGKEVVSYGNNKNKRELCIGKVFSMGYTTDTDVSIDIDSLTMHSFISGSTGSGKSNTIYEILYQCYNFYNIPFLVIEPAKGEYKNVFGQYPYVSVYGTNPKKSHLLKINPFSFPEDVHILEHLDRLVEIFNVCWPMYAAMPAILKEAIERSYCMAGWDLELSINPNGNKFPNFADVLEQIQNVINDSAYSNDSKGDYSGALLTRVHSLTTGLNRMIFTRDEISNEELFDKCAIIDLSRIGSSETKSLIMGLVIMKLNEYRMSSINTNNSLSHITVLEEAHNLLRRTSTEQSSENANILGKSVELLANSIAEMRTYGEGFIIADQAPELLDQSVIRNTNTKIILRLPDRADRILVGYAAGLKEEQIDEIQKLKKGVAAVYQNDWLEPVLVKINKYAFDIKPYNFTEQYTEISKSNIKIQLLDFLIQGRVNEKLNFSIDNIEKGLYSLGFSTINNDFIEDQILEYKQFNTLKIWSDEHFAKLSKQICELFNVRNSVENCVLTASNDAELTTMLNKIVLQISPDSSDSKTLALCQCFMKDMSLQKEESEIRKKIYIKWVNYIKERSVR